MTNGIFKGYIFDIDGTLTSTNELIFASFNYVINKYLNKTLSNEEIISLFGPTEDVILREWLKDNYEEAKEDYYKFYRDNHSKLAKIVPGIEEIIREIKQNKIPLGIFTGKGKQSSLITLEELGIVDYFDLIITGDDVKNHKPSPEGINLFLNKFNLPPESVLMIGDAPVDIKAAHDAKVKVAAVVWDSYAKEKVLDMEYDFLFHSPEELKVFISENIKKGRL
ncbi:MAG: HAD family hydrolase [Ignavibacteria bacterium]|nr:MAG: HAD family hydrolase [Ignavibacteria bacterium]